MATDRMYLRCPCGRDDFQLARYLSPPWQMSGSGVDMRALLNEWFIKHQFCGTEYKDGSSNYPARPVIKYESDDDYMEGWKPRTPEQERKVQESIANAPRWAYSPDTGEWTPHTPSPKSVSKDHGPHPC